MFFGAYARALLVAFTAFWLTCFLISRGVLFLNAWSLAQRAQQDDTWLLAQCRNPEFFSKLRHHADLCAHAQSSSERDPLVVALAAVANTTHLCGTRPCLDLLMEARDHPIPPVRHIGGVAASSVLLAWALWALLSRAARALLMPPLTAGSRRLRPQIYHHVTQRNRPNAHGI